MFHIIVSMMCCEKLEPYSYVDEDGALITYQMVDNDKKIYELCSSHPVSKARNEEGFAGLHIYAEGLLIPPIHRYMYVHQFVEGSRLVEKTKCCRIVLRILHISSVVSGWQPRFRIRTPGKRFS